jgi:integrase
MPRKHLTDRAIKSLTTALAQEDFIDDGFTRRGITFGLRVSRTGTKEFFVRYRDIAKRYRRFSLGDAALLSLAKAHEKASDISSKLDQGLDPAKDRDSYKNAITFSDLCSHYLSIHARLKKDGGQEDSRIIKADLLPAWGARKACDIHRRDVIALLDSIGIQRAVPIMANRTRALISGIFTFAVEREFVSSSPCYGLKKKFKEKSKDRFLSDIEIKALWNQVTEEAPETRAALLLIILTGQRPGEVIKAKWTDISPDHAWRLSNEQTKNGRSQIVPLNSGAIDILNDLRRRCDPNDCIFKTSRSQHIKHRSLQNATRRIAIKAKIPFFTPHDLRRTAATLLRKTGTRRETLTKILNHVSNSVTDVYDHYNEAPEKRDALEKLWKHIQPLIPLQTEHKAVA